MHLILNRSVARLRLQVLLLHKHVLDLLTVMGLITVYVPLYGFFT